MNTTISQYADQILDGSDLDQSQIEMLDQQSRDAFDDLLYYANNLVSLSDLI